MLEHGGVTPRCSMRYLPTMPLECDGRWECCWRIGEQRGVPRRWPDDHGLAFADECCAFLKVDGAGYRPCRPFPMDGLELGRISQRRFFPPCG